MRAFFDLLGRNSGILDARSESERCAGARFRGNSWNFGHSGSERDRVAMKSRQKYAGYVWGQNVGGITYFCSERAQFDIFFGSVSGATVWLVSGNLR